MIESMLYAIVMVLIIICLLAFAKLSDDQINIKFSGSRYTYVYDEDTQAQYERTTRKISEAKA